MPSELIISVSGLRGVVGESLTPDIATRYALAFAAELPLGPIVISHDGRESGPTFADAISRAVAAAGFEAHVVGTAATPTVGVLVRSHCDSGGIQISASHNPPQYNGIKLFDRTGRVIPAELGQRVLERFRSPGAIAAAKHVPSIVMRLPDATSAHLKLVEQVCDVDRIRRRGFRVVLDANHGAGAILGDELLKRLGCAAIVLGETPDGQFEHPPEPTAANLATVLDQIPGHNADIGFCQDPDADRLAIIDERGRYLGEEYTLALCADHVLRSQCRGPIVTNCSTSRMSEDLARKYGVPYFRSKVGEANVVDVMLQENAALGGEGNGGVIDPRVGMVRDSFAAMALVLDAMADRGLAVSELADELPRYAIHKTTIALQPELLPAAFAALQRHFVDAAADGLDGLRLDWPDGAWLLVRPSNTEPIVRAIAEAPASDRAVRLCDEAAQLIAGV